MPLFKQNRDSRLEPVMTTGVASKKLGISPELLRFYENEGLLVIYHTETGRRLYCQADLDWINGFREVMAKDKLNIAGIRLPLALMPCWDIKNCSQEERKNCPAYLNHRVICWQVRVPTSETCVTTDCRDCNVYREACRPGSLDKMFIIGTREQSGESQN